MHTLLVDTRGTGHVPLPADDMVNCGSIDFQDGIKHNLRNYKIIINTLSASRKSMEVKKDDNDALK